VDNIIEAYEQHKADCIAMSGLLVKSTAFMKENLETFKPGITVPVILGARLLRPSLSIKTAKTQYKAVVYKDAFSDLNFMDKLMPAKKANGIIFGILDGLAETAQVSENGYKEPVGDAEAVVTTPAVSSNQPKSNC